MTETDVWFHLTQVEFRVSGTVHRNGDQAWILRLAGCRIYEMYVPAELDVVELRIRFEEVSHVQQGDLTHHRTVELSHLNHWTFLLPQRRRRRHVCVGLHLRYDIDRRQFKT